jgi:hypothetical protein
MEDLLGNYNASDADSTEDESDSDTTIKYTMAYDEIDEEDLA